MIKSEDTKFVKDIKKLEKINPNEQLLISSSIAVASIGTITAMISQINPNIPPPTTFLFMVSSSFFVLSMNIENRIKTLKNELFLLKEKLHECGYEEDANSISKVVKGRRSFVRKTKTEENNRKKKEKLRIALISIGLMGVIGEAITLPSFSFTNVISVLSGFWVSSFSITIEMLILLKEMMKVKRNVSLFKQKLKYGYGISIDDMYLELQKIEGIESEGKVK